MFKKDTLEIMPDTRINDHRVQCLHGEFLLNIALK